MILKALGYLALTGSCFALRVGEVCGEEFEDNNGGWEIVYSTNFDDPRDPASLVSINSSPAVDRGFLLVPPATDGQIWLKAPTSFLNGLTDASAIEIRLTTPAFGVSSSSATFFIANGTTTATTFSEDPSFGTGATLNYTGLFSRDIDSMVTAGGRMRVDLGTTFDAGATITDFYIRLDPLTFMGEDIEVDYIRPVFIEDTNWQFTSRGWTAFIHDSVTNPTDTGGRRGEAVTGIDFELLCATEDLTVGPELWFQAPARYLGDWRRTIELKIEQANIIPPVTPASQIPDQGLALFITDGTNTAFYEFPADDLLYSTTETLSVLVTEDLWTINGNWDTLISNVTGLYMRTSFAGDDTFCMGNFKRTDCLASALTSPGPIIVDSTRERRLVTAYTAPAGNAYTLQSSFGLRNWNDVETVTGADALVENFFLRGSDGPNFFRLITDVPIMTGGGGTGGMTMTDLNLETAFEQLNLFGQTTVYRSALTSTREATISQLTLLDQNRLSGADGVFSGFDLDFILFDLDGDLATTTDQTRPTSATLTPGTVRDPDRTRFEPTLSHPGPLFGSDTASIVNESLTTLGVRDAFFELPLFVDSSSGFLTLGDGGSVTVSFPATTFPADTPFYLFIGEAGLRDGENLGGSVVIPATTTAPTVNFPSLGISFITNLIFVTELGKNYQIQSSSDDATWTDYQMPFPGTASTDPEVRRIPEQEEPGPFFRVIEVI